MATLVSKVLAVVVKIVLLPVTVAGNVAQVVSEEAHEIRQAQGQSPQVNIYDDTRK